MCGYKKPLIKYGNKYFVDVTNETTGGETFTDREAKIYGETGKRVACSS